MTNKKHLVIGIDATNLRRGGGVTHLLELLSSAKPNEFGIERIVVWGMEETLNALDDRSWLEKHKTFNLNKGLIKIIWQRFYLSQAARNTGCDLLFVPGGSFFCNFKPIVTMSRNMLPFMWNELKRYGWSFFTIKLILLRFIQSHSYRNADGVIFLTKFAQKTVLEVVGKLKAKIITIPHGLNPRFKNKPRIQRPIDDYNNQKPYRLLYVSIIDKYKHQWNVVEAVSILRQQGIPVVLDLVGPSYLPALKLLNNTIDSQKGQSWVVYHGAINFDILHSFYHKADLGLFASTCENMPNILIETMASGLPIACSNRNPMPEVLGNGGVYFDPENSSEIALVLRDLITSPTLRSKIAHESFQLSQKFTWERCAAETLEFLVGLKIKG